MKKNNNRKKDVKGFTLIELLIVIAIIAILAAVVFVALDPLTRFQDARDSSRWADVSGLISAIKIDQVDNGGSYISAITDMTNAEVYMIGSCTSGATAVGITDYCDIDPTQTACVDLSGLATEGYIASIPVSPNGGGIWTSSIVGYTIEKRSNGILFIRACESENSDGGIEVAR